MVRRRAQSMCPSPLLECTDHGSVTHICRDLDQTPRKPDLRWHRLTRAIFLPPADCCRHLLAARLVGRRSLAGDIPPGAPGDTPADVSWPSGRLELLYKQHLFCCCHGNTIPSIVPEGAIIDSL